MLKVKQIIEEEFDGRLGVMVMTYLLGQLGMDAAARISDEDIEALDGNALMTRDFIQALVRTARRIAKECDFTNDVIPYIVKELGYLAKERR